MVHQSSVSSRWASVILSPDTHQPTNYHSQHTLSQSTTMSSTNPSTSQKRPRSASPPSAKPRRPQPSGSEVVEEHTCSLCLKLLIHPVTTLCNHHFCQPCLKGLFGMGSVTGRTERLRADWEVDDVVTRPIPLCRRDVMKRVVKSINVEMVCLTFSMHLFSHSVIHSRCKLHSQDNQLEQKFPVTYPLRLQELTVDEEDVPAPLPTITKKTLHRKPSQFVHIPPIRKSYRNLTSGLSSSVWTLQPTKPPTSTASKSNSSILLQLW